MNKKIAIILVSLTIGAILGITGSILITSKISANVMQILALEERVEWVERAYGAYKNEDPTIAIWALTNLSEVLEKHAKIYINYKNIIQTDLIITYGRLAKIYKGQGKNDKYKEFIIKALALAREMNSQLQPEDKLLDFLDKVDNIRK